MATRRTAAILALAALALGVSFWPWPHVAPAGAAQSGSSMARGKAPLWDGTRPGELVRLPDGRRMNLRCAGSGGPTVIFDAGWEGSSPGWTQVAALEAPKRRVCAYDRAGSGFSDPGPEPRDAAAIAADLDALTQAAHLRGPFILVGHSSGSLYALAFAAREPSQIAGLVLIEPAVPHGDQRYGRIFGPGAGSFKSLEDRTQRCLDAARRHALPSSDPLLAKCDARLPASAFAAQLAEISSLQGPSSDEALAAIPAVSHLPLIVLTAADTNSALPAMSRWAVDAASDSFHQEIARYSSRGAWRLIERSGHLMPNDRPDAIAQAIDDVAAEAAGINRPTGGRRRSAGS